MNFIVSGATGYIGSYFCEAAKIAGHRIVESPYEASVGIHLEWRHLPNYDSAIHYNNVWPRLETLLDWKKRGLNNVLVAGTSLELVPHPPHYARAKLALLGEASQIPYHLLKWVRLFNVWGGDRERPDRLVSKLLAARYRAMVDLPKREFRVKDVVRDFRHVKLVAADLLRIAEQPCGGIYQSCSGVGMSVAEFAKSFVGESINIVADQEIPNYEPRKLVGNPNEVLPLP